MVDASENGMAAVCYLRFIKSDAISCSIVAAKTRVASLRFTSISRMELAAAILGARLALTFRISSKLYWSDSRDVLCWINSDHRRYSQYVGHRISEILDISEAHEWRWVPSKLNCADDATKWTSLPDMSSDHRCFKGASFLWHTKENWPPFLTLKGSTENKHRSSLMAHHVPLEPVIRVTEFSSWKKLVRIAALVYRLVYYYLRKRAKKPIPTRPLTANDLMIAERSLIRLAQRESYPDEIAALQKASRTESMLHNSQNKHTIPKTCTIYQLTPKLDEYGIMRMRTRIAACHYATEDTKQPIILNRKHHTTTLIVAHYHSKNHHQNHENVINEIRQKFCIPQIRACFNRVRMSAMQEPSRRTQPTVYGRSSSGPACCFLTTVHARGSGLFQAN
ncbi:uncharacterized protein LOC129720014 [Wyeomyia smithii]|uniref:uncharacterized protein LOC129720014 n=1 Tax=Wyeomyia smithii TaxID=174621 RepID=UPI002467E6F3|nr:uncharacterized protein LOC129720014 [Wyeomyia smithii]